MDNIFDTILGLVLGAIGMYWLFNFFKGKKSKEITTHQSTVLLEKMKSVCKLISCDSCGSVGTWKFQHTYLTCINVFSSREIACFLSKEPLFRGEWFGSLQFFSIL